MVWKLCKKYFRSKSKVKLFLTYWILVLRQEQFLFSKQRICLFCISREQLKREKAKDKIIALRGGRQTKFYSQHYT
jgi:hypothetical protein